MAAAADTTTYDEYSEYVDPDWTVVLPWKRRKCQSKVSRTEQEAKEQSFAPPDLEINQERESKLLQKIETCLKKLESSKFFNLFLSQIEDPEVFNCFSRVLGSEPNMNMVVYGIGSIESFEAPRLQLCLVILMKRKFEWVGNIEVFDPVLSGTETRVLESFGCSVISVNEEGRRQALKPTLFFMPHCEALLYHNLLEVNWNVDMLRNMALFGNSFEAYEHHNSVVKDYIASPYTKRILASRSFVKEFRVKTGPDDHNRAFYESSWLFFNPNDEHEVFIKGRYVGGVDLIRQWNETGELHKILQSLPTRDRRFVCDSCGDGRFLPCSNCSGSRKIFDEDEEVMKRCLECNENGLIRCPECCL